MKEHLAVKILVAIFSLSVGGAVVWQVKNNLEGEEKPSETTEVETEARVLAVGSKSLGGVLKLSEVDRDWELAIPPDDPDSEVVPQPLLPGSKSGVILKIED